MLSIAAASLALSGCGGGDDSDEQPAGESKPADTLSESEFVEQLDAICKEGDEVSDAANEKFERLRGRARTEDEAREGVVEILDEAIPEQEELMERARDLEPPSSEEDFAESFFDSQARTVALNKSARDAYDRGDDAAGQSLIEEAHRLSERRAGLVEGHGGFEHCGEENE